jgi:hypothetical protein
VLGIQPDNAQGRLPVSIKSMKGLTVVEVWMRNVQIAPTQCRNLRALGTSRRSLCYELSGTERREISDGS